MGTKLLNGVYTMYIKRADLARLISSDRWSAYKNDLAYRRCNGQKVRVVRV